jgi:predicted DNA-binding transcriptional regulator YafY
MREDILAKRAKGVSAAKLAEKYGVSTAYIYMIK